jgi:hypothetical protein
MTVKWVVFSLSVGMMVACGGASPQPKTAGADTESPPSEVAASSSAKTDGGIHFEGGDGSSCEKPIIIVGAKGEMDGVASEYEWIQQRYPEAERKSQALIDCNGAPADRMVIVTRDGREVSLVFDISDFFGKL